MEQAYRLFRDRLHVECCLGPPQSGTEPALELRAVSLLLSCANHSPPRARNWRYWLASLGAGIAAPLIRVSMRLPLDGELRIP